MTSLPYEFESSAPRACPVCGAPLCTCRGVTNVAGAKLATENTVVRTPSGYEFLVAAGDPIPEGVELLQYGGYVENTPNTADAAQNEPDAADRVEDKGGPGPHVIATFGTAPSGGVDASGKLVEGYVETGGADATETGVERPKRNAKRAELDAYAKAVGLDPAEYDNKDDLNEALDKREDGGFD